MNNNFNFSNKKWLLNRAIKISLISIIIIYSLYGCSSIPTNDDKASTGSRVEVSSNSLTNIIDSDVIDLTNKTGDELVALMYWISSNADEYENKRIIYDGYTLTSFYGDNIYHNLVVTSDLFLEDGESNDYDNLYHIGFEYTLDDENYIESGKRVHVEGTISYYDEDGSLYSMLKDPTITLLEE